MRPFVSFARVVIAALLLAVMAPVLAQDTHPEEAWQTVITRQIEAFRDGDAPEAFAYAGAGFQKAFPNAVVFFRSIIASGYAPIMESKSHSFGAFERFGQGVVQVVKFIGANQELYDAAYELIEEADGWRVQGVALGQPTGLGI